MFYKHLQDHQIVDFRDDGMRDTAVMFHIAECGVCRGRLMDAVLMAGLLRSKTYVAEGAHLNDEQVEMTYSIAYAWEECDPNRSWFRRLVHLSRCDVCLEKFLRFSRTLEPSLEARTNAISVLAQGGGVTPIGSLLVRRSPRRAIADYRPPSTKAAAQEQQIADFLASIGGTPSEGTRQAQAAVTIGLGGLELRMDAQPEGLLFELGPPAGLKAPWKLISMDQFATTLSSSDIDPGGSELLPWERLHSVEVSALDRRWTLQIRIRQVVELPEEVAERKRRAAEGGEKRRQLKEHLRSLGPIERLREIAANENVSIYAFRNVLPPLSDDVLNHVEVPLIEGLILRLKGVKRGRLLEFRAQLVEYLDRKSAGR